MRLLVPILLSLIFLSCASSETEEAETGVRGKVYAKVCDGGEDSLLAGIEVEFMKADSSGSRKFVSDDKGEFELFLDPGEYHVSAKPSRDVFVNLHTYRHYQSEKPWVVANKGFLEEKITLAQTGFTGQVYGGPDKNSELVTGARVLITDTSGENNMGISLAAGRFTIYVPAGKYAVEVKHPAYKMFYSEVPIWEAGSECITEMDVFLEPREE